VLMTSRLRSSCDEARGCSPRPTRESSGCQVITHPGQEAWMNVHKNARLTPRRRQELVMRLEAGEPLKRVARRFAVSAHTARKWRTRYEADGEAGLADRSRRPHTSPRLTAARLQLAAKVLRQLPRSTNRSRPARSSRRPVLGQIRSWGKSETVSASLTRPISSSQYLEQRDVLMGGRKD
jgi:transposase-like protein